MCEYYAGRHTHHVELIDDICMLNDRDAGKYYSNAAEPYVVYFLLEDGKIQVAL
jgi:hypothetical protein